MTVRSCLFPVAGYGTRFLPATKSIPKEMLTVVDKPLIQYGVEEAYHAGILRMLFVTGRSKRALEDHFDMNYELEHRLKDDSPLRELQTLMDACEFSYTRQNTPKGLGHAVLTGKNLVGNEPFAVLLADDLILSAGANVLAQLLSVYEEERAIVVAVQQVPDEEVHQYGIASGAAGETSANYDVVGMYEKVQPDQVEGRMAVVGRYILTPEVFGYLENTPPGRGNEIQLTDALNAMIADGHRVVAVTFEGERFDCGSVDGFITANNVMYNKRKESRGNDHG